MNAGVDSGYEFSTLMIEDLASKIAEKESFLKRIAEDVHSRLKERIINLMKENASLKHALDEKKKIANEIDQGIFDESLNCDNISLKQTEFKVIFRKRLNNFDVDKAEEVKKVRQILLPSDDDEELQISEQIRESDFKCPVTGMRMVDPMKR